METVKVQLRIPLELHEKIVEWAKKSHRSMNKQILAALEEMLSKTNENGTTSVKP